MCNTIINAIAVKTTLSRLTNALFYYSTRSTEPVIKNLFLLTVKRFPTVRSHHVRLECKSLVTNKCEWKDRSFTWKRCWWKSVTSSSNQTVQALNACYHSTWDAVESNRQSWKRILKIIFFLPAAKFTYPLPILDTDLSHIPGSLLDQLSPTSMPVNLYLESHMASNTTLIRCL